MPADIPGFYYDSNKKKYFRITADNEAAPNSAAAKYTASAVSKHKASEKRAKRQKLWDRRKDRETVKRASVLQHGVSACLRRETGRHTGLESYAAQFGVSGFSAVRERRFDRARISSESNDYIQTIARHRSTGAILVCCPLDKGVFRINECSDFRRANVGSVYSWDQEAPPRRLLLAGQCQETLLCAGADGMVTCTRMPANPRLALGQVDILYHFLDIRDDLMLSDAALCPDRGMPRIALAMDGMPVLDITRREPLGYLSRRSRPDNLSVRWQSQSVLAWGDRAGNVKLGDLRAPSNTVVRIAHPSAAVHIRYADTSPASPRLVVAGLDNRLALYDLRYCRAAESVPWLDYPAYQNRSNLNLGFDIEPEMGLAVAAKDCGGVEVLDLWRGSRLATSGAFDVPADPEAIPPAGAGPKSRLQLRVGCVQFERDDEETADGVGYCLLGAGSYVRRAIWGRIPHNHRDKAVRGLCEAGGKRGARGLLPGEDEA